MAAKHQRLVAGDKDAFVDPAGYEAYIAGREGAFRATLAEQQKELAGALAARAGAASAAAAPAAGR